jgi:hypothetical protein
MSEKDGKLSPEEYQNKMLELASAQVGSAIDMKSLIQKMLGEKAKASVRIIEETSVDIPETVSGVTAVQSRIAASPHEAEVRTMYEEAYQKIARNLTVDLDAEKKIRFLPLMACKGFKEQNVRWARFKDGKIFDKEGGRPRKRMEKYDSYMCLISPKDYDKANDLDGGYFGSKIYQGTNVLFLVDEEIEQFMKAICVMQGLSSLMEMVNEKKNAKDGQQINATFRIGLIGCLTADWLTENGFSDGVKSFLNKYRLDNPEKVTDFLLSCSQTQLAELDAFFSDEPIVAVRDRMLRNGIYVWALLINSSKSEDRENFNFKSLPQDIYRAYRRFESQKKAQLKSAGR